MKPTRILILLSMVLLLFVLVPVAAAERPIVFAGAGTGTGASLSTYAFRVHYNSIAGGQLWVSRQVPGHPEHSGAFTATLAYGSASAGFFSAVSTVVESTHPDYGPGMEVQFFYERVEGVDYILAIGPYFFPVDTGHVTLLY
jgi:hypothetical protein